MVWDNDSIHPRTLGSADDGSEIAHVCDVVEQQDQRRFFGLHQSRYQLYGIMEPDGRDESHHPLVVAFCQTVELFLRHKLEGDALVADSRLELGGKGACQPVLNQYAVYAHTTVNGFHHRAKTIDGGGGLPAVGRGWDGLLFLYHVWWD